MTRRRPPSAIEPGSGDDEPAESSGADAAFDLAQDLLHSALDEVRTSGPQREVLGASRLGQLLDDSGRAPAIAVEALSTALDDPSRVCADRHALVAPQTTATVSAASSHPLWDR
ncbi:MAG: hypothetical protein R6X23_14770 [Acidimicrobiia bacterium]